MSNEVYTLELNFVPDDSGLSRLERLCSKTVQTANTAATTQTGMMTELLLAGLTAGVARSALGRRSTSRYGNRVRRPSLGNKALQADDSVASFRTEAAANLVTIDRNKLGQALQDAVNRGRVAGRQELFKELKVRPVKTFSSTTQIGTTLARQQVNTDLSSLPGSLRRIAESGAQRVTFKPTEVYRQVVRGYNIPEVTREALQRARGLEDRAFLRDVMRENAEYVELKYTSEVPAPISISDYSIQE